MEGNRAESRSKELEFEYRDYLENGEGMPAGTEVGDYKIEREIGKGAFGKIYLARDRRGASFAVKLMDLEKIRREANPKIQEIRWRLVRNEPALMQQCDSPNVLRCWEIFENESLKVLILEYCNGHTLQEFLDRKIRINEEEAVRILRQVINGIAVPLPPRRSCTSTASSTATSRPTTSWSTRGSTRSSTSVSRRNSISPTSRQR